MEIQLSIRHNLPAEGDLFGSVRVEKFGGTHALCIGADASCDCPIADRDTFAPRHFELIPPARGGRQWTMRLAPPRTDVFINGSRAADGDPVGSGDEIRVGHWTLQFHRNPRRGEFQFRRDRAAAVNRMLVAALLLGELTVILWLPQQLQSSSLWETGRIRQGSALAIDTLRKELGRGPDSQDPAAAAAYQLLAEEMAGLAGFLRQHGQNLQREQWEAVRETVENSRRIKERIDRGGVLQPLPEIELEPAVQAVLQRRPSNPPPPEEEAQHE